MAKRPVKNKNKNKKDIANYKLKFDTVNKYVNFSFNKRNKLTPARKAAITRAYNKYAELEKAGYEFVKITNKNKKEVGKLKSETGKAYKSGKGVFVYKKPGTNKIKVKKAKKGDYTIVFEQMAILNETAGINFYTYLLHDPARFALDPEYWIALLPRYKQADMLRVNVGDANFMSDISYSKKRWSNYIVNLTGRDGEEIEEFVTGITLGYLKGKYKKLGYYQRQL